MQEVYGEVGAHLLDVRFVCPRSPDRIDPGPIPAHRIGPRACQVRGLGVDPSHHGFGFHQRGEFFDGQEVGPDLADTDRAHFVVWFEVPAAAVVALAVPCRVAVLVGGAGFFVAVHPAVGGLDAGHDFTPQSAHRTAPCSHWLARACAIAARAWATASSAAIAVWVCWWS